MDMDPCVVASRAEIVAQKLDLTPSEHAGVALSEVTTLVSGRGYPKVATMEPANGGTQNRPGAYQPKWCEVCKISCSGDKAFDIHIEGKQHQKNLKFSEKTPTLYVKTMEESKSLDGNGNAITWCEVCNISCPTNIYGKHASGKKHIKNLQKLDKIPNLPSTVTDSASSLEGKDVNSIKINSTSCELCGISCTSLELLNTHIAGKKHQKKLKNAEKQCAPAPAPEPKTLFPESDEEGKIVILEGGKRKADDSLSDVDADTKKQKMSEDEACGVLVSCKVCNVSCTGFTVFQTHLASVEHLAMVQKQAEGGSDGLQV
ncbi:uncharacterized protein LOC143558504 [Bidens hawaiensis]|uniref:uncharacterized protein LOC143558504 n=1 Tax=Bidens hawaiensis TaxID=980011 RepID=UPI0040499337